MQGKQKDLPENNLLDSILASDASLEVCTEYDFYTDDPEARISIRWARPEAAAIKLKLLEGTTGKELNLPLTELPLQGGEMREIRIPLADLAPGEYDITAAALADGKEIATARDRLIKLPKGPMEVRLNRFLRGMVVDGKPFFPVFLPLPPDRLGDWHLGQLKEAGFNCLAAPLGKLWQAEILKSGVPPAMAAEIRNQLDRLEAQGLKFIWPITWSYQDWPKIREITGGDARVFSSIMAKIVETFKDHHAIIAWYLLDEPATRTWQDECGFQERDMQILHASVKAADPYRPAYVNWNHSWKTEPYGGLACTDIMSHDNYMISGEPFDWELLVPSVRMINDKRAGHKPGFIWISGSFDELFITPGPDPVRVHAWLHLVYGSRGLGYWDKHPMNPEVWNEMKSINHETAFLNSYVFGPASARPLAVSTQGERIHYAIWDNGGKAYLFGINTGSRPADFNLDLAKAAGITVVGGRRLFDEGEPVIKDGLLSDEFPACGRRIYELELKK